MAFETRDPFLIRQVHEYSIEVFMLFSHYDWLLLARFDLFGVCHV